MGCHLARALVGSPVSEAVIIIIAKSKDNIFGKPVLKWTEENSTIVEIQTTNCAMAKNKQGHYQNDLLLDLYQRDL